MTPDFQKLLQGHYEAERLPKDFSSDRVVPDYAFNILNPLGLLYRPIVDERHLENGGKRPIWPDNKTFAACLTHDVDFVSLHSYNQFIRMLLTRLMFKYSSFSKLKGSLPSILKIANAFENVNRYDPLHCYERWIKIEKDAEGLSTFFFWPGWSNVNKHHITDCTYELYDQISFDGQKCSVGEMIQEIDRRGWEIGLHPSWYSFNNLDELKRQKTALENILGHEVESIRQHFLHHDIRLTPRLQAEAGFKYDSTLGFNDNIGFRFGTSYAWFLYDLEMKRNLPIMEIPLIVQDGSMLNPQKGMRIDVPVAFEYIKQLTEAVERVGGILTLSFHPNLIIEPDYWGLYIQTINYLKGKNPWIASVKEIGQWFIQNHPIRS